MVLAGSIAIDRIMNFKVRYKDLIQPEKLHVLSVSVLVDKLQRSHGGIGANIAYNLALLGEQPILLGAAGKDAEDYLQKLSQLGVDVSHVHLSELPTASFSVLTDLDDNQVGGFYLGAMGDSTTLSLIPWKGKNALAVISAHDPDAMRQQVDECVTHDIRYCYDVGPQVTNIVAEDIKAGLAKTELLFVNDYELGVMAKKVGQPEGKVKNSVPVCVTTLGKQGCKIEGNQVDGSIEVPAVSKAKVVDPTGAGDAFRAGFLFGYVRDLPLEKCARLGSVAASFAIEERGTQEHSFSLADCQERYQQTYGEKLGI